MFKKNKECLCVSLDDSILKMIRLKVVNSGKEILGAFRRDLNGIDEAEWPGTIKSAVGELGVKDAISIAAIPLSLITTKNIEIPSLDPEEIKSIIDLQAGRHTPYSREEILVGYINIGIFQRNYTKILLIIVNRDVVKKQIVLFEEAGILIEKVVFSPESIVRFYEQVLNVKENDAPVGIIDIAYQKTSFTVGFNKTAAMCRSIPLGLNSLIKEGEDARSKLIEEISQSVEAYQNEDINELPQQYILTGDDVKIKELQPLLEEKLKTSVKIIPYLEHVEANEEVMLKFVSEYNDESFLEVISAATSVLETEVDLTPDEIKTQRIIERKAKEVLKAGVLTIAFLVFVCAIFLSKIYFRSNYFSNIEAEYSEKHRKVVLLDRVAQKTRIIKDYLHMRMVNLETFDELYSIVPDEIYLQSITLDEKSKISIRGISETMSIVFNFVSALENSDFFKNVKPVSTTDSKDRGKDVAFFHIEFKLESALDEDEGAGGPEQVEGEVE